MGVLIVFHSYSMLVVLCSFSLQFCASAGGGGGVLKEGSIISSKGVDPGAL